ncbi:MAG: type II and III secretion system protein [Planctomycetota bacterium]
MAADRRETRARVTRGLSLLAVVLLAPLAAAQQPMPSLETLLQGAQRVLGNLPEPIPASAPEPAGPQFRMPLDVAVNEDPVEVESDREGLISLTVRQARLRDVLSALADTQGLNLIVAAPAEMPVTAQFNRLPLDQVLRSLLSSTGHTWTRHDNVLVITSVAGATELTPDVQGRRVAVIELDFASAADLQPAVEGLLSSVGTSHFIETNPTDNRRTKEVLIVEDLEPFVARVERYIAEADQAPRQVLIEVSILQIDLNDTQRAGVDWNALSRVSGAELTMRSAGFTNATAAPGFFIESIGGDLDTVIDALISTTDAKALATPRLMAVNGQTSQLQIGERLGYRVTTTTETSSLESVEFLEVGVVLSMTPRITRDGRVLLRVSPKVSTGAVSPDTGVPDEETTELQTDALLNSGQGIILGGLIQEADDVRINRVPVLGSLPYVNGLFQRRQVTKRRSELIVALVPHVMPLSPGLECRQQHELMRAREPLTTGPLCRHPRPYEATLYDPQRDEARLRCLDRRDPGCNPNGGPRCTVCPAPTLAAEAATPPAAAAARGKLRRLPPVAPERTAISVQPMVR